MAKEVFPTIKVNAWNVTPPSGGTMPTTTATNLQPRTVKLSTKRGRAFELDNDEVGTAQFDMRDDDAMWYGGDSFQPGQPVQVTATVGGQTYNVFTGYWDSLPWSQPSPFEGTATVHAQDMMGVFNNRLLQSTMTEYVLANTTCDAYFLQGHELIGGTTHTTTGGPAGALAEPNGYMDVPWSGSFNGDTALNFTSANMYSFGVPFSTAVLGGGTMLPSTTTTKTYGAVVGFSVQNNTDSFPIFHFLDSWANPTATCWYSNGSIYVRGYGSTKVNTNRDAWGSSGSVSPYVSTYTRALGVGDHIVSFQMNYSSSTLWSFSGAIDGATFSNSLNTDSSIAFGGFPTSLAIGSAINCGAGANASWLYSSVSAGTPGSPTVTTWNTSGASLYGPAIWIGGSTPTQWSAIAANEYGADTGATSVQLTSVINDIQTWAGGTTIQYPNENAQTLLRRPHAFGSSLLNYLQQAATCIAARVFATSSGQLKMVGRGALQLAVNKSGLTVWNIGQGGYIYTGAPDFAYDLTRVASEVQVQAPDTTALYYTPGKRVLGPNWRSLSTSSQTTDPAGQAQWLQDRYSTPLPRPGQYTFNPAADSSLWPFVFGAELGDLVHVTHYSPGRPSLTFYGYIESIAHEADAETGEWLTKMDISPRLGDYWILEDATYGILDQTTVAGWGG